MKSLKPYFILILTLLVVTFSSSLYGQSHESEDSHEFKHFRVAVGIGHAYIPEASNSNTDFVVIPAFGLEAQYWFNHKWGLALKSDIEVATYFVENENRDSNEIIRKNPVIMAIPVLFSPWNNHFTFILGPGIEFEEQKNFSVFRIGIGSEIEFGNHWDFAPEIIYDLKDGHINSLTIAIGVGKRF